WNDAVEELPICDSDSEVIIKAKKLLKLTLVRSFKAVSPAALNPLKDVTTLGKVHLNQLVHPAIDSALWIFSNVNYVYEEIPLQGQESKLRADGIGYINDVVNYIIICCEGARPGAPNKKKIDDESKNTKSMVGLYNYIITSEVEARKQLYIDLRTYGITAFRTDISLTMLDFRGAYRLFEVDRYSLPRDWTDMPNFVYMYGALVKWS
ncbi:6672_t:CDS:2, partial [Paraglomus occultum]